MRMFERSVRTRNDSPAVMTHISVRRRINVRHITARLTPFTPSVLSVIDLRCEHLRAVCAALLEKVRRVINVYPYAVRLYRRMWKEHAPLCDVTRPGLPLFLK